MSTSYDTHGVVRPTPAGRWAASHGSGSYTHMLGEFDTDVAAVAAAGAGGRRVIRARLGETGYAAESREDRERIAATVGLPVDWMSDGNVTAVTVTEDERQVLSRCHTLGAWRDRTTHVDALDALEERGLLTVEYEGLAPRFTLTTFGQVVADAVAAEHAAAAVLVCSGTTNVAYLVDPTKTPYHRRGERFFCPCGGWAYLGDLEPAPAADRGPAVAAPAPFADGP